MWWGGAGVVMRGGMAWHGWRGMAREGWAGVSGTGGCGVVGWGAWGGVGAGDEMECEGWRMAHSRHFRTGVHNVQARRRSRPVIAGTSITSSGQGPETAICRALKALASQRALLSYRASH